MAIYFLINTVLVGTQKLVAGSKIDDAFFDTTKITDAGGVLWPDDTNGANVVAAAALKAQAASLRGANEAACESLMQAAMSNVNNVSVGTAASRADAARERTVVLTISQAQIAAKGAVTSATFDAASAFPANARLLGCEVSVGTKIQNVGDTDTTTLDVGTDGAGKSAIAGSALAKTAGLKGGAAGIGFAVGGEKLRVTLNSTVNLSTITAGAVTVTATYDVPAAT